MRGLLAIAALSLISCAQPRPRPLTENTVQELQSIRNLKVYFGHQSVGGNILDGLREIETQAGVFPAIADSLIGQNGDPVGKCEDFSRKLAELPEPPDVALMKFCYIDFDQNTDPGKLFTRYAATLDALQTKYPQVTFVPVTAPLTIISPAWKRTLKSLMGSVDAASAANARRAGFNAMIAKRYAGHPVFDVARIESTFPDGSRSQFDWSGQTAYSLVDAYTSDGGHLNELGRKLAAEELIHTLAATARVRSARVSPVASDKDSTSR
jgi:hypothetical protein